MGPSRVATYKRYSYSGEDFWTTKDRQSRALPEVGDVNLSPLGCQVPNLVVTFRMSLVLFAEHVGENDEGAYTCPRLIIKQA